MKKHPLLHLFFMPSNALFLVLNLAPENYVTGASEIGWKGWFYYSNYKSIYRRKSWLIIILGST